MTFRLFFLLSAAALLTACSQPETSSFDGDGTWIQYSPEATGFSIWSPEADSVRLNLYTEGDGDNLEASYSMRPGDEDIWALQVNRDLQGVYYTYQVKHEGKWLDETPGIYAQAVGTNGQRAMVLDSKLTNPKGWNKDKGPELAEPNDAIIYELHIRDMSIHPESGVEQKGKYLGLVEAAAGPDSVRTSLAHLMEMGITHVHLLPTFDHYSIDESRLENPQFNWGYDPQNYNVPEGSFSTDPSKAALRNFEFKNMVSALHDAGIGVILDVVYNHTGRTDESNFNLEAPGAYYRFNEDGSYSDASGCGNETASDHPRMREYMINSVLYWAEEYHIDGFRFDLMGIHDLETMEQLANALEEYDPNIFVYGEGWTAGGSPLAEDQRALKKHTLQLTHVAAFSDDIRDGLKGSVFDEHSTGFVSGASGTEESVKFGVVGSIQHPQVDYAAVNYSNEPWAREPWQSVSYVSCHDNHTLFDKLMVSREDASESELIAMHKLANAVVLTSQGIPFLHAGVEMLRTKGGEHNSYKSPDAVNQIDWQRKNDYAEVVEYYRNLIHFRKAHPAFSLPSAELVRTALEFKTVEDGLISYTIDGSAAADWSQIMVVYNARTSAQNISLDGDWKTAVMGDEFGSGTALSGSVRVPAMSMAVFYQE